MGGGSVGDGATATLKRSIVKVVIGCDEAAYDLKETLRAFIESDGYEVEDFGAFIDELGFVPLSKTGAELLFETISQRYEQGAILITSNLPFDEWTEIFGSERLTGALLDRLTHHVNILEMNGESYRLSQSRSRKNAAQLSSHLWNGPDGEPLLTAPKWPTFEPPNGRILLWR